MRKNNLKNIFNKKIEDYTYFILFLIIFSIFIFFAISPSLKTAFSLKKEKKDLEKIDQIYEEKILSIYNMQEGLEKNREKIYLIDEAVSINPQVNKMIDDIKKIADKNNFFIKKANITDINLSNNKKELNKIDLILEGKTEFNNLMNFFLDIFDQRRLKIIKSLFINKEKETTDSDKINVTLIVESYYF